MNQPIENRPTFDICNSSSAHSLVYHMYYKIDQHGSSSCKSTFGLMYFMGSNTMIFAVLKGWHDALTLCYKLINFYIDLNWSTATETVEISSTQLFDE